MRSNRRRTPVREALIAQSALAVHVQNGLGAVKDRDKPFIDSSIRTQFADSIDTDEAFRVGHDQEPRWDYLLGHERGQLVAVEPHRAHTQEVKVIINKKKALQQQLHDHLKDGKTITTWLWVASGTACFTRSSKYQFLLSQAGIKFVGRCVMAKHLP